MFLALFHTERRQVFRGKRVENSLFGHTFGGNTDYSGRVPHEGQVPVHLLFHLNTLDPAVGVKLPNAQWLPLFCAIRYGACPLGYRVVSDSEIEILHQAERRAWEDFPYKDFPEFLSAQPVAFEHHPYDPSNGGDVLFYAGVFGYEGLSSKDHENLIRHIEKEDLCEVFGCDSVEEVLELALGMPFVQGPPEDGCPNPQCINHGREASLRTLVIFQEAETAYCELWGPWSENLQIIYQICPRCSAIFVTNQCT